MNKEVKLWDLVEFEDKIWQVIHVMTPLAVIQQSDGSLTDGTRRIVAQSELKVIATDIKSDPGIQTPVADKTDAEPSKEPDKEQIPVTEEMKWVQQLKPRSGNQLAIDGIPPANQDGTYVAHLAWRVRVVCQNAQYNGKVENLKDYVRLCAMLCIPFGLIFVQPDLGTGLIILVTGAIIIICSGPKPIWVVVTIGLIVAGSAFIIIESSIEGIPHILKTYQLNRLIVFVDPSVDPYGSAYNLQQAKIAVGSGGLFGKGLGNATQAASGFLPESHTDFVFALLAEEFGFVGSVLLLGLFAWMILSTVVLAMRIDAPFPKLVLVGCAAMWSFQVLENVGMCIGIMPITGIPLPYISFGSSSMIAQIMAIGMVQSMWMHRQKVG